MLIEPKGAATHTLAHAFADRHPIDVALLNGGLLDPEKLIDDFKNWFGREVKTLAGRIGRPEKDLTQVTDKTLRNWRRNDRSNKSE